MIRILPFIKDESGATALTYGLIASSTSVAIIGSASSMGVSISGTFECVSDQMAGYPCAGAIISDTSPLSTRGQGNNHAYTGYDLGNGWTVTMGNVDGNGNVIDLNGSGAMGQISKEIETQPGKEYVVTFDHGINGYQDITIERSFEVSAAGQTQGFVNNTGVMDGSPRGTADFLSDSFTFTADSTTTTLSFTSTASDGRISSAGSLIRDINVERL